MDLRIRSETTADMVAIDALNRLAFGQEGEARLVAALRQSTRFIPEFSLVAVQDGDLVGHILFNLIEIVGERVVPAIGLAPMAVLPARQRQGIGSRMVREGIELIRRLGHGGIIVVGHPEYYPRFGFLRASTFGIRAPFPVPDEAFLALPLRAGGLEGCAGVVRYPPEFSEVT